MKTTSARIEAIARAIAKLIETGAYEVAADLLRHEIEPLAQHVGTEQIERWCLALALPSLIDLPNAIAAAHEVRELQGSAAIAKFIAIARTAQSRGDEIAEFRALSGLYCTGILVWAGLRDMEREARRIDSLYDSTSNRLSDEERAECLAGLLCARVLFGGALAASAPIGEALIPLVVSDRIGERARLRAATALAPWFNHTRDIDRLRQIDDAMEPLCNRESVASVTRTIYRAAMNLARTYLKLTGSESTLGKKAPLADNSLEETLIGDEEDSPQWLRFFARRNAFEYSLRGGDYAQAAQWLKRLDAIADPAVPTELLAVHRARSELAIRLHDYTVAHAQSRRCVELTEVLDIPTSMAMLYHGGVAMALMGLNRLTEARAIYTSIIDKTLPGHRFGYEKMLALIDAIRAIDEQAARDEEGIAASDRDREALRQRLIEYLRICGGRLLLYEAQAIPHIARRLVSAIFAEDLGSEGFGTSVLACKLAPPSNRPTRWPWRLRLRLFDGFVVEGLLATAHEHNKKGDSRTAKILQYLAAHAPTPVSVQRMADHLWPEAEGDKAMRALDVALTRLRALLPDASLLVRAEGKIGFDLDYIWCDTHAALALIEQLRARSSADAANADATTASKAQVLTDSTHARVALELLALYRGPLLPDSSEPYARDRAAFFRSQLAGAAQIGLRAAIRLPDSTMAEEIVRKSVAHGLPADVVRFVLAELRARGNDTSRRAEQLSNVFDLARG